MNQLTNEYRGSIFSSEDRYFISPLRKVYETSNSKLEFSEFHKNEKLAALSNYSYEGRPIDLRPYNLDFTKPPFVRISCTNDKGVEIEEYHNTDLSMVELRKTGTSSVLLSPAPIKMVREAYQNDKRVLIKVPKPFDKGTHRNRRYGALKLPNEHGNEVRNVLDSDFLGRIFGGKRLAGLRAPKNAPLFVNIKFEYNAGTDTTSHIDGAIDKQEVGFDKKINGGDYLAQIFEDSICDGCVSAKIITSSSHGQDNDSHNSNIFPAVSFVTAPDFFPLVDSNDIRSRFPDDHHFYEGGTMNLSSIRLRGNPNIINPYTNEAAFKKNYEDDKSFDTNLAIVSSRANESLDKKKSSFNISHERDYRASSFLPDTGTGVFYPAWDVTYSNDNSNSNHFLATIGLGSPFPEDMKLCAAANGMWPVTSPDAGRTFQGSLDYLLGGRPNTSIPLMDDELGFHLNSPSVRVWNNDESFGWDGEQGPFFQVSRNEVLVNYTDIARADYMLNLTKGPGFDMSKLRELEVKELTLRMECLENCIDALKNKKVWQTKLWLVSASKINNWKKPQELKVLPKDNLFANINYAVRQDDSLDGEGYFFVFAKVPENKHGEDSDIDTKDKYLKRRKIKCSEVWVCQASVDLVTFTELIGKTEELPKWTSSDCFS
jgi:hypothetical protein